MALMGHHRHTQRTRTNGKKALFTFGAKIETKASSRQSAIAGYFNKFSTSIIERVLTNN